MATLDSADFTGLNVLLGANQVLRIRGRNLNARLVRLASGRFELQDFLPEKSDQPLDVPFDAQIDNVNVRLVDLAGRPWRSTLKSPRLFVAGVGDDWVAHGGGDISGIGRTEARIQSIEGFGINILASSDRLELAPLINHLTT